MRVYSIDQDKSFPITDGLSEVTDPVFDKSGSYLFFLASTDAGPVKDWFAQSTADSRMHAGDSTSRCCATICRRRSRKESDEEKGAAADEAKKAEEKKNPLPGPDTTTADAQRAAADKPARLAGRWASKPGADVKSEAGAAAKKPAVVRIDFEGLPYRIFDLPVPVGEYSSLQPGTDGQDLLPAHGRRQVGAAAVRSEDAQGGDGCCRM